MILLTLALSAAFAVSPVAPPATIDLHVACAKKSETCVEFPNTTPGASAQLGEKQVGYSFSEKTVKSAQLIKDGVGRDMLNVVLTADAAKEFAAFTKKNIGNGVLITLDREVVATPVIQAEIKGGALMMNLAKLQNPTKQLERVAWLKTLIEKSKK